MYHLQKQFDAGVLPAALKERYRVADGPAMKVALFLLCGGAGEEETVADALSMPLETVRRALSFWHSAGLLTDDPAAVEAPQDTKIVLREISAPPEPERVPLSPARMSEMALCNPDIAVLLQEAQNFLGRTLDSNESRMLLEVLEYDALPVDVILMILAWCAPRAKSRRSIIGMAARTAALWREDGIDTPRAAEKHIRLLEQREEREKQVAEILSLESADFNKTQRGYIARWFEEYGYDIEFVREAFFRTGNNSVNYLNAVIKGWHQNGYKTLRDTLAAPSNAPAPVSKKPKNEEDSFLKRALKKRSKTKETAHGLQ